MNNIFSGVRCRSGSPLIISNTIVNNGGTYGSGISVDSPASPVIERNIVAYNTQRGDYAAYGGIYTENPDIIIVCNDVYDNSGPNYSGIDDQTGINGNFSSDPLFCDPENGLFTIHTSSPCMPQNHPYGDDCGLIGAYGPGCCFIETLVLSHGVRHQNEEIRVEWETSEPIPVDAFMVYRAESLDRIFLELDREVFTHTGSSYWLIDSDISPGKEYTYRIDYADGNEVIGLFESGPARVPAHDLALHQNHPNPFNPSTSIGYYLPSRTDVTLTVFDVSGRTVARLVDGMEDPGSRTVNWDGMNERGVPVTSGTYFYRLTAGKESVSRKMILLR
jgi:hypothetical protein